MYAVYERSGSSGGYEAVHELDHDKYSGDDKKAEPKLALSLSSAPETKAEVKSFNHRFQEALSLPETTHKDALAKYFRLNELSTDFVAIAKLYTRTIIAELHLPPSRKTVPEAGIGGLAGGKKFIVGDVMLKLCLDVPIGGRFLYGSETRRDDFAMKAAGLELKSAIAYFQFHSLGIRVPLSALVDCCGFRLLAMPVLPISKSTLICECSIRFPILCSFIAHAVLSCVAASCCRRQRRRRREHPRRGRGLQRANDAVRREPSPGRARSHGFERQVGAAARGGRLRGPPRRRRQVLPAGSGKYAEPSLLHFPARACVDDAG